MRVGVLGCGTVGSSLISLVQRQRDTIAGAHRAAARGHPRGRARRRPAPRPSTSRPRCFTTDAAAGRRRPRRSTSWSRSWAASSRPAAGARRPSTPASRWSPPTRSCWPATGAELFAAADAAGVDLLFEAAVAGGIPIVRPAARVAAGRADPPGDGHRQRHHQLHPHPDDRGGRRLRRGPGRGPGAGLRRGRPHRRRRGLRRRRQDRHRGHHRLRGARRGRRRLPRGHQPASPPTTSPSPPGTATSSSCWPSPSGSTATTGRRSWPCGCTRRCVPDTHPLASVRESFNAVFVEGDAVGELMFYGRGAGGVPTASAVLGDLIDAAVNLAQGTQRRHRHAAPAAAIAPVDELRRPVLRQPRGGRPPGRAGRGGRRRSATTACRSARWSRRAPDDRRPRPGRSSPTWRRERDLRATLHELRDLDAVRRVGSVIRVLGDEERDREPMQLRQHPGRGAGARASPTCCWPAWPATAGSTCPTRGRRSPPGALSRFADRPTPRSPSRSCGPSSRARIDRDDFAAIVADAYATFDAPEVVPLVDLGDDLWLVELFHGPTLAFKDVALQLVGRLFDHELAARGERVTIVGATSGDTGSAAIEACRDRDGHRHLHPAPRRPGVRGAAPPDDHGRCRRTSTTSPSRAPSTTARTW